MIESFGARLREERERRNISLADIAARTKIKASLFASIERDDATHWPSGIFRRSFMRAYADAVGLDADAIVREFLERFPDPAAPEPERLSRNQAPAATVQPVLVAESTGSGGNPQSLRLLLVDTGLPFTGGRVLADARRRWAAAAWDLGSLIAIAVTVFIFLDAFWMPFGVIALCYYVGGVLVLGNSPGVCLFAPKPEEGEETPAAPAPARVPRPRHTEPQVRAAESSSRPHRFRTGRQRQVRG